MPEIGVISDFDGCRRIYKSSELERFYVYALVDPRTSFIFYVGKGSGRRFKTHEMDCRLGHIANVAKHQAIAAIKADGDEYHAYCLKDDLTEHAAFRLERQVIERIGLKNLTNVTRGENDVMSKRRAFAADRLSRMYSLEEWCAITPRTEKEIASYHLIRGEFEKMAEHGFYSTIRSVNGRAHFAP